jgi:hypothetical protein
MNDTELARLSERVGKGTEWLRDNDPRSRFHTWFQAGLTPASPRGRHDAATWTAWETYYKARLIWEALMARLEKEEKRRLPAQLPSPGWQPARSVRGHP